MQVSLAALRRAALLDNFSITDPQARRRKPVIGASRWPAWFGAGYGVGFTCGAAVTVAHRLSWPAVLLTLVTVVAIGCFRRIGLAGPIEGGSTRA